MISPKDLKVGSLYKTAAMTISFTKEIDEWVSYFLPKDNFVVYMGIENDSWYSFFHLKSKKKIYYYREIYVFPFELTL